MKRALLAIALAAAAATALVALPSRAYERSRGAVEPRPCLWWPEPTGVPVVSNLSDGPTGAGCTSSQVPSLIEASLATWGAAQRPGEGQTCTSFRFEYQGSTIAKATGFDGRPGAPNENLIVFRHGLCDGHPLCGGSDLEACADQIGCWPHDTLAEIAGSRTIAITTTSFDRNTGEIVDADMELHDSSAPGVGFFFTCAPAGPACRRGAEPDGTCISTDAGSILTHEAGHMLGLDHPDVQSATMFATYVPGSVDLRELDLDDVNGVCEVYPAGRPPLRTCTGTSGPPVQVPTDRPSSGGGCSTTGGGVLSMVGAALALGLRRAPRAARTREAGQDTTTPA